jgi:hypothetical protein
MDLMRTIRGTRVNEDFERVNSVFFGKHAHKTNQNSHKDCAPPNDTKAPQRT